MTRRARLSLRPTALGCKGMLLFAALELAFFATSYSNLFFLLLAFCCALGATGLWWTLHNLRGVQVATVEVPLAPAGAQRTIRLLLDGGRRRRFGVTVSMPCAVDAHSLAWVLRIDGHTALQGVLAPQPRGVRLIEHVQLRSRFPFGLFEARIDVPVASELITWPTPAGSRSHGGLAPGDEPLDDAGTMSRGRGADWSGLREFRDGDAIADVHWKATARRGTAVIKERQREQSDVLQLVLDRRLAEPTFERALADAAALALAAATGAPIELHSQGMRLRVGNARSELDVALRWLAAATTLPADAPAPSRRTDALALPLRSGGHA